MMDGFVVVLVYFVFLIAFNNFRYYWEDILLLLFSFFHPVSNTSKILLQDLHLFKILLNLHKNASLMNKINILNKLVTINTAIR